MPHDRIEQKLASSNASLCGFTPSRAFSGWKSWGPLPSSEIAIEKSNSLNDLRETRRSGAPNLRQFETVQGRWIVRGKIKRSNLNWNFGGAARI
jgi:hypothetical protein